MLDFDLAELYEVQTKVLNQAVKRNLQRFPIDFMFRLTLDEWESINYLLEKDKLQIDQSQRKRIGFVSENENA